MTGNHRSPGADVIDVAVALDIEEVSALRTFHEYRRAVQPFEGSHGRVHAPRNMATREVKQFSRCGHGILYINDLLPMRSKAHGAWQAIRQALPARGLVAVRQALPGKVLRLFTRRW